MPKHSESSSLGQLSHFRTGPVTTKERVQALEVRVSDLEKLLNECLMQISTMQEQMDKPVRDQNLNGERKSHPSRPKRNHTPKKKNGKGTVKKRKYPQNVEPLHVELADKIVALMGLHNGEMTRAKICEDLDIAERTCGIAFSVLFVQNRAEKTERRDAEGNAIWKLKS